MNLSQQLRAQGYRLTPQRQIILETLHDLGGHLTANQIYDQVQKRSSAIDRATVYRTLNLLQEIDIIHSSRIAGQLIYEIIGEEPHHHLICDNCGGVHRLGDHHFETLVEHLLDEHKFHAHMHHLTISGLCQYCWESEQAHGQKAS